eukprot:CAMPEP_0197637472 /NCGR_PEP_ID=MMETSP1338-20131121/12692_1 /TAXON_ID=43686 ORGANISM="Pelagodinium beii, Strain RCC1491" /NCGR_SAMPLE_ID=MMETSP1338 /ASSEMBLY_ACC=CAM_ASM_000754 /LENGTH=852 /DNA_ID=CAMNT_0043209899 /DNA_START=10 /DNA_END=2568 /DNA_ORIENTATION=-
MAGLVPPPSRGKTSERLSSTMRAGSPKTYMKDGKSLNAGHSTFSQNGSAWHEVLEMCKKGFAVKMENLTGEIVSDVQAEVQSAVQTLRKEITEVMAEHEAPLSKKLSDFSKQIARLEQIAVDKAPPPDLTPVLEQLFTAEQAQQSANAMLERRIEEVSKAGQSMATSMETLLTRLEAQVQNLEQKASSSDERLKEVQVMQQNLNVSANAIASELKSFHQEDKDDLSQLSNVLQTNVVATMTDMQSRVEQLDLNEVQEDIFRSRRQIDADFRTVLSEISRIQQALQLDFVQVLTDKVASLRAANAVPALASSGLDETEDGEAAAEASELSQAQLSGKRQTILNPISNLVRKRLRDVLVQTGEDEEARKDVWAQTDPMMFEEGQKKPKKKIAKKKTFQEQTQKGGMASADKLAQKAKEASMKPPYNVTDEYWETGMFQAIARKNWFENLTLLMVALNAGWMAVDADLNKAPTLLEADAVFVIGENIFCTYFFVELIIRFGAFQIKSHAFKDFWFIFDLFMVLLMVFETWIFTAVLHFGSLDFSLSSGGGPLRMLRLVKLMKLSRLVKLLRAFPELVIIIKGLGFAARSVAIFFLFWVILVFVFAVLCRQLTNGLAVGEQWFPDVMTAFNTLLIQAIFPEMAEMLKSAVTINDWYMWPILVAFILLTSITVMYMLVGVLVSVVGVVSKVETESLTVAYVAGEMREAFEKLGQNPESPITKYEFESLIVEPSIAKIANDVGVDVVILSDMLELLYEDIERKGLPGMAFTQLIDMVLSMRGSNPATVKDCKEQIRIVKLLFADQLKQLNKSLSKRFEDLRQDIQEIREDIKDEEFQNQRGSMYGSDEVLDVPEAADE